MTYLASGLVVIKAVLALLHGSSLGLAGHVLLDTNDLTLLGLVGEGIGSWELALGLNRQ
jgi:hypothetical protein